MKIKIRRIYDKPAKHEEISVLVDRLWPRGVKKEEANIDKWAKELAPSNDLRKWFHEDPSKRFTEFKKRYRKELKEKKWILDLLGVKNSLTLVTAVKDIEHSHIPVLQKFLERYI